MVLLWKIVVYNGHVGIFGLARYVLIITGFEVQLWMMRSSLRVSRISVEANWSINFTRVINEVYCYLSTSENWRFLIWFIKLIRDISYYSSMKSKRKRNIWFLLMPWNKWNWWLESLIRKFVFDASSNFRMMN